MWIPKKKDPQGNWISYPAIDDATKQKMESDLFTKGKYTFEKVSDSKPTVNVTQVPTVKAKTNTESKPKAPVGVDPVLPETEQ